MLVPSPTLSETLRCLTDSYRGQGKLEDAAELEKLKMMDKTQREHILLKLRDGRTSAKKIEPKISSISSKKRVCSYHTQTCGTYNIFFSPA